MSAEPRLRLTRDAVLRRAIELADLGGIEALTMRKLGVELGVEAMSLYNHVANKGDLLGGMIDIVFSEVDLPSGSSGWRPALRQRSVSLRQTLIRHPWAIGLMDSGASPGPFTLRHHDGVLGGLREGGFSVAQAAHAFSVIDSYVYGFAMQEKNLPFQTPQETVEMATGMLEPFPAGEFPYLAEFIADYAMKPGYSYANEFEIGLDLVLEGLERLRDEG